MNKRMRGGGGGNVDVCACTVNGNRESGTKVHSKYTFMCTCAHVPAVL